MSTTATPVDGGNAYLINGQKLWVHNGNIADVLVVMAKTPSKIVNGKEKTRSPRLSSRPKIHPVLK